MILADERPDRFAASAWRHYYHSEGSAEALAEAMIWHQSQYQWDFMKINPRADYHIEGWGFRQLLSTNEFEKHTKQQFPITTHTDWIGIRPLSPTSPALAELLSAIKLIRKGVGSDVPLFMTVFTPLAIAGRMVSEPRLLRDHLSQHPDLVLQAIEAITQTFELFVAETRNAGADGIFLATTSWASSDQLTWEEYQRFALPFDLRLLAAAESDAINLLHVCGSNTMLRELLAHPYPVRLVNYNAADPTNPPLDKMISSFPKQVMMGGIDHDGWLRYSDPMEIRHLVHKLRDQFDPTRLIIAPGCTYDPSVPAANLRAVSEAIR